MSTISPVERNGYALVFFRPAASGFEDFGPEAAHFTDFGFRTHPILAGRGLRTSVACNSTSPASDVVDAGSSVGASASLPKLPVVISFGKSESNSRVRLRMERSGWSRAVEIRR